MAYVRKRGSQLAIVHGTRNPETGTVEQEILFTIYSKPEALEILGRSKTGVNHRFRAWLEEEWPGLRIDWKKIREGIEADIERLPESHDYQTTRSREEFEPALREFARQLIVTDPRRLVSSWRLIREHRIELEFVRDLIDAHLEIPAPKPEHAEWMEDNPFHWRHVMSRNAVPAETDEFIEQILESGDLDRAERLYTLLTEMFDSYADGHNCLGLIAFERGNFSRAAEHFREAVEVGKRLLPKRVAKDSWWTDLSTRPYMRGLRSLALAFTCDGRYDEALQVCATLDECEDDLTTASFRASIHLSRCEWSAALDSALFIRRIQTLDSLIAAFAAFELGDAQTARTSFLHAVMNFPSAVGEVLGKRVESSSRSDSPAEGAHLAHTVRGFLNSQSRASKRFFSKLWRESEPLREEQLDAASRWEATRTSGTPDRGAFDLLTEMKTVEFAEATWGEEVDE